MTRNLLLISISIVLGWLIWSFVMLDINPLNWEKFDRLSMVSVSTGVGFILFMRKDFEEI